MFFFLCSSCCHICSAYIPPVLTSLEKKEFYSHSVIDLHPRDPRDLHPYSPIDSLSAIRALNKDTPTTNPHPKDKSLQIHLTSISHIHHTISPIPHSIPPWRCSRRYRRLPPTQPLTVRGRRSRSHVRFTRCLPPSCCTATDTERRTSSSSRDSLPNRSDSSALRAQRRSSERSPRAVHSRRSSAGSLVRFLSYFPSLESLFNVPYMVIITICRKSMPCSPSSRIPIMTICSR